MIGRRSFIVSGIRVVELSEGYPIFVFFFSSRRRHTRCSRDWSSDVCSSDLVDPKTGAIRTAGIFPNPGNLLRPGQYGRVRAITATKEEALLVPQRAVTELQGRDRKSVV